jgi:hypothetical protein
MNKIIYGVVEGCECGKLLARPLPEEKVRQQSNLAVRATAGGFSSKSCGLGNFLLF